MNSKFDVRAFEKNSMAKKRLNSSEIGLANSEITMLADSRK